MEQKISTRGLTEAAIMAAFISIVVILSSYLSILYGVAMLLLPILVAVIHYKHDMKYSLGCVIVSILITAMMFNPISAIIMGVSYGIVGITLGYGVRKKYSPYKILILTIIASGIAIIADFWLTGLLISGQNLFVFMKSQAMEMSDIFLASIEQAEKLNKAMGMSAQSEMMNQMKAVMSPEYILMMFPAIFVLTGFLQGYVSFIILIKILKRLKYEDIESLRFREFYVTNLVGAFLISIMCIALILVGRGVSWAPSVYNAIFLITIVILSINGIATVQYFLTIKMGLPRVSRVLIIVAAFMMGSLIIFGIIGFIEMLLDFRKLDPHRLRKA